MQSWAQGQSQVLLVQGGHERVGQVEPRQRDQHRPLNFSTSIKVLVLLSQICSSGREPIMSGKASTLAFSMVYRISEIVTPSRSDPGNKCLQGEHLLLGSGHMTIRLRWSKTDQIVKGKYSRLDYIDDDTLCLVCNMQAYVSTGVQRGSPLFCHREGSYLSRF
ncbi:hypothetical protein NDU88_008476 [Pleurodeles waltl]|uniref:Uncharacterized protein n=1 Tax=Pleurodeles waltl TaxID=8319 RepID=A0AAV7N910_PLEWA|nr:hypothetical protein NDU88_008476 [Pleurodeles waltl]